VANAGILHPGAMGTSVAATIQNGGNRVYWVSEGRSVQTRQRAEKLGLILVGTLEELCAICEMIISVCPPHAAEEVAEQVAIHSYQGIYLDANAISPQKAIRIGERMNAVGAKVVDGGIIGPPAWEAGKTWLYLSGEGASEAASYFSAGPLETCVLESSIGKASALKMCYAAYTKGTAALLCGILATAEALEVREHLEKEWSRDGSDFAQVTRERVRRVTAKAWRFAGEMEEIAATFQEAGMPGGFHTAAGMIYRRMADFKDFPSAPELEEVLEALLQQD
jgi:3-hydroxyisobutyrate dehydrogenase-like beta-hydroxyacid dehydrogenase